MKVRVQAEMETEIDERLLTMGIENEVARRLKLAGFHVTKLIEALPVENTRVVAALDPERGA